MRRVFLTMLLFLGLGVNHTFAQLTENQKEENREYSKVLNNPDIRFSQSQYPYLVLRNGNGRPIFENDTIVYHLIIRDLNGNELENTHQYNEPTKSRFGKLLVGLKEVLNVVSEGAVIKMWTSPRTTQNEKAEEIFSKQILEIEVEWVSTISIQIKEELGIDSLVINSSDEPKVVGGKNAFLRNLNYPESDKKLQREGLVKVSFIVNENGSTSDYKIISSPSVAMSKAVIEAIAKTKFFPGMLNGKLVKSRFTIPVTFKLSDFEN
ncbi:energy transducer TonB [bacterium]|nr:MAG: energy transducer TonB [bacterium]